MSRRALAASVALAMLLVGAVSTTAVAHPTPEHALQEEGEEGLGVKVNSPENLAGFIPGVLWSGTPMPNFETSDLVYAGTGCTPAHYAAAGVDGKIAIVDDVNGSLFPGDTCVYAFVQKVQSAQAAGAIGLIQVEHDDEIFEGNAVAGDIPAIAVANSDGAPIRDAVIEGTTVNVTLTSPQLEPLSNVPCVDGMAGPFPCDGIDLLSFVPQQEFDGAGVSDIWGWTDSETGDEYVFFGKTNGTAFFRVTDPLNPVYLGELPNPAAVHLDWHDIKVYENHAFIVSESQPHGMTVFDLTRLRGVSEPQEFDRDAWYPLPFAAHNVAINEDTGFAYIVGGNFGLVVPDQCLSGLHMVDISTPTQPTFAGCYLFAGGPGTAARTVGGPAEDVSPAAYVHDTQCVIYEGPDDRYTGRELCFNASEDQVTIADVTNKLLPTTVGFTDYPNVTYAHQGWLSEDQRFLFVNDELDEEEHGINTRTIVLDVSDLENPKVHFQHFHDTISIDHNNYVHEGLLYQSNYTSGLRVLDTRFVDKKKPRLKQVAFFDTYPAHSDPTFDGTWSNYPFFESGTIAVSGRAEGLFLLRLQDDVAPRAGVAIRCADCPIEVQAGETGTAELVVSNTGNVTDAYRLSLSAVQKVTSGRATVQPRRLRLGAGEEGTSTLTVRVPRGARAGTYELVVTATSSTDPSVSDSETVEIIVRKDRP